jgi:hypothetical protein
MIDGRYILNYLNSKDEFWYWGVNNIQIDGDSIEFNAHKDIKHTAFRIKVGVNGFLVSLYRNTLFKKHKLVKQYKNVQPVNLTEVISSIVFQQDKIAA